MTRVTAVIKGLGPGGSERLLVELARVARGHGVELSIISLLEQKRHLIPEIEAAGVRVRCLGVTRLQDLRWITRIVGQARRDRPDVLHVHSPAVAPALRILARLRVLGWRRPRVVSTEHNAWGTYHRLTRLANAVTAPLDDAIIAVSDEVRRSIRPAWLARRAITIRHGIDVAAARQHGGNRALLRSEWGIATDDTVVVTVANYRKQKNYPVLLEACSLATKRIPTLRFVVVGQGPGASEVHRLHEELGLGDRMLLLGYRPDAIAVMGAADIFTLSSDYEGLPVSLMEALALGLAVVTTAVGGITETITADSGRTVAPRDPAALANAIVEVASDRELLARLRHGASSLADTFDVHHSAEALAAVYQRLSARR